MDLEKLIERVVGELDDYSLADVNNEHSARILRAAFAEVRRAAIALPGGVLMTTPKTPDLAAVVARASSRARDVEVFGRMCTTIDRADLEALCAAAERVGDLERQVGYEQERNLNNVTAAQADLAALRAELSVANEAANKERSRVDESWRQLAAVVRERDALRERLAVLTEALRPIVEAFARERRRAYKCSQIRGDSFDRWPETHTLPLTCEFKTWRAIEAAARTPGAPHEAE